MIDAGTLVMKMDSGYIASVIQAVIGLMSVLCPNGLYDKCLVLTKRVLKVF